MRSHLAHACFVQMTDYPCSQVTASQFQDLMNDINAQLVSANSFGHAVLDNILMVATFHLALLIRKSHFESVRRRLSPALPDGR